MVFLPPLPMVFWPPIHGILTPLSMVYWPPYPCHFDPLSIDPPTHGILTPYPWYFDPPTHYFDPLSMVFWPPYPWYFDLPTVYRSPYPWYIDPSTHGILTPPIHGILTSLPMIFWPPTHGISNPLLWYYEPLFFGRNEGVNLPWGGSKYNDEKSTLGSKYHITLAILSEQPSDKLPGAGPYWKPYILCYRRLI